MRFKSVIFVFFISVFSLTAQNDFPLMERAKALGMTFYWDSLSETGMLEKNGHQLSFRRGDSLVLLDNARISLTDAPVLLDNQLYVSARFMDNAEILFKDDDGSHFKVGAILLDPGHGGKDPGASKTYTVGAKQITVREKDVNLRAAQLLYERLKTAYPDKQIILTRNSDVYLSLSERTEIANSVKVKKDEAILFISIHQNSSLNKSSSGYEVWYLSPGYRRSVLDKTEGEYDASLFPILNSMLEEEYTTESIMIAKFIMDGLQGQVGNVAKARGIKAEEWFVVKNTNMPSVLIEMGFVSNQEEALRLNDDQYLKKATLGIYNGIAAFITHFERSKGFTSANGN